MQYSRGPRSLRARCRRAGQAGNSLPANPRRQGVDKWWRWAKSPKSTRKVGRGVQEPAADCRKSVPTLRACRKSRRSRQGKETNKVSKKLGIPRARTYCRSLFYGWARATGRSGQHHGRESLGGLKSPGVGHPPPPAGGQWESSCSSMVATWAAKEFRKEAG